MKDPIPENISGSKVQTHSFEHKINWSYVILGVIAVYALFQVGKIVDEGNTQGDDERDLGVMGS